MNPQPPAPPTSRIPRVLFVAIAIALCALSTFALIQAGVFCFIYTSLFSRVTEITGLDVWASRAITLALCALVWCLPWHLLILPWFGSAKRQVTTLVVFAAFAVVAMEVVTRDVYFSRSDGRPLKYFIQTLDGYKFAAAPGTDPVYGVPYQPITAEVAHHYILWKARGGRMQDPALPESQYFNPGTGEPLRWYTKLPNGRIDMFTLPGFHPTYGMKLLPATAEAVTAYEKQKAEAERQRQEELKKERQRTEEQARQNARETARKASEEATRKAREEQEAHRKARAEAIRKQKEERDRQAREEALLQQPLQPGRYLFPDPRPSGTIAGFKFTLSERDLAGDKMLIHLEVANAGVDPNTELPPRFIRLALVAQDGAAIAYTAIRAKEGGVVEQTGGIYFPSVGKRGAFVMEFQRPEAIGSFSVTVNDQALLAAITLHHATFQSF